MGGIGAKALLAARAAAAAASQRSIVLMSMGRTGRRYAPSSGGSFKTVAQKRIPAGTIVGGELLRIKTLFSKYQPFSSGANIRVTMSNSAATCQAINGTAADDGVTLLQSSAAGSVGSYTLRGELHISACRKFAFTTSINAYNLTGSIAAGATLVPDAITSGSTFQAGVRAASTAIKFIYNSGAPTVETVIVDFTRDVYLNFDVQLQNSDSGELMSLLAELVRDGDTQTNYAPADSTIVLGHSIVEGTGTTPVSGVPMDYVSQLGRARPYRAFVNGGLGGQTISQIVARALADPIIGKQWDMVFDGLVNDATGDGAAWWNTVKTQLDLLFAYRKAGARTIISNCYPQTTWTTGTALRNAMDYVNAQLAADPVYGPLVVDVCTPFIAGGSNGVGPAVNYADTVHPTNTGSTILKTAIDNKMTALGW